MSNKIEKADKATRIALSRRAVKMGELLLQENIPRSIIEARYFAIRERIKNGTIFSCEHCGGSMPLVVTDKESFLSTTCSAKCEDELFQENPSARQRRLPQQPMIVAPLNTFQYGGRMATILEADIAEVELLGINAMVHISTTSKDDGSEIFSRVRIAAFARNYQSAIIKSIVDEVTLGEARRMLFHEAMLEAKNKMIFRPASSDSSYY